jgi:hypothetical protein
MLAGGINATLLRSREVRASSQPGKRPRHVMKHLGH